MMRKLYGLLALVIAMGLWPRTAAAAEWRALWSSGPGTISGPVAAVTAGPGRMMAAAATDPGHLVLMDPQGKVVWDRKLRDRAFQSPAAGDVNGDGVDEILVADQSSIVYCFDVEGRLHWQFSLANREPDWYMLLSRLNGWAYASTPRVANVRGDRRNEVVLGDTAGWVTCLDGAGDLLWRVRLPDQINCTPCVDDVDGDGAAEVIAPCADGRVYCLGARGELKWQTAIGGDASHSSPVAGDLRGDGRHVVVTGTSEGRLAALRGDTGAIAWTFAAGRGIRSALALADLNGDGKLEVMCGNEGNRSEGYADFFCLNAEGKQLWTRRFTRPDLFVMFEWPFPVGDFLGDSQVRMILVPTYSQQVYLVNATGAIEARYDLKGATQGCALLPHFGADATLKLVVTDNSATCFDLGVDGGQARLLWPRTVDAAPRPARTLREASRRATSSGAQIVVSPPRHTDNGWYALTLAAPKARKPVTLAALVTTPSGANYGMVRRLTGGASAAPVRFEALTDGAYVVSAKLTADNGAQMGQSVTTLTVSPVAAAAKRLSKALRVLQRREAQLRPVNPPASRYLTAARKRLASQATALGARATSAERGQRERTTALRTAAEEADRLVAWSAVLARAQKRGPALAFIATPAQNPWAPFDPGATPGAAVSAVRLSAYQGEYHSVALNIANFSDAPLKVRARVADTQLGVTLRKVVDVQSMRGVTVWDALPLLDAGSTLTVPAWAARQLWVTVASPRGRSGDQRAVLTLDAPGAKAPSQRIALQVKALPIARPAKSPLSFISWAYLQRWPLGSALRRDATEDLLRHGSNTFYDLPGPKATFDADGNLTGPLDFTAHDAAIRPLAGRAQFLLQSVPLTGPTPDLSPAWKKAMRPYLQAWVAHLKELGVTYGDFAMYPFDEPHGPRFDMLLDYARTVKAIDPRVRMYADLAGVLPTSRQLKEATTSGLIDIYQPWQGHFEDRVPQWLGQLKATGKQIWMYRESNNMKELDPLGYYRRMPWLAWRRGLTGFGIYVYFSNNWTTPPDSNSEYGMVYTLDDKIVPSKRWEAVREGIQDYEALWLLRQAITAAKAQGRDTRAAQQLLANAPKRVLDTRVDYGVLSSYRPRIVAETLRLTGAGR